MPEPKKLFTLCSHCDKAIELWLTRWNGTPFWSHSRDLREARPHTPEPKVPFVDHIPAGFGTVAYWPSPGSLGGSCDA